MKKKVLTIILMVTIVSAGLFAVNQQRLNTQDEINYGKNNNPMYVELSDGTYKNVETNSIIDEEALPEYCKLIGGEGQSNEKNLQSKRNLKNNENSRLRDDSSYSRKNKNSNNQRYYKNR